MEKLCKDMPSEIETYMTYCRTLDYEKAPNYAYLKRLLRDTFTKNQFEQDSIFDWTIQRF